MAKGSLNLRVGKEDFVTRIETVSVKMKALEDVIDRYGQAKANLNQFVEEGDSTYQSWVDRIDANIKAAKKAWTSLQEVKVSLETTVNQMEGMTSQIRTTIEHGTEAAISTVEAAIKVAPLL